jgi:hypothetical protein
MEFCPKCGRIVQPDAAYCQNCGALLTTTHGGYSSRQPFDTMGTQARPKYYPGGKNPWLAAALALGLGVFGIWGIGHMYAGRFARGVGLFFIGLVMGALFWLSVVLTIILIGYVGMILFGIFFIGGWLWQGFDAYNTAEEYNELYAVPPRTSW